jgi:ABC-type uncharacterized transport system involved in gliding motility auxiliary subunit
MGMSASVKSWRGALGRRTTRFGANALVTIFIVLGVLILINFLSHRHHRRFDTTAANRFSLADQTIKLLHGLSQDVIIMAFSQGEDRSLKDLLSEYAFRSKHLTYRLIDPDKEPGLAKEHDITQYGTIVVTSGDREERIFSASEQDLTNAILKVTREGQKIIYVLEGHAEKDIDSSQPSGYQMAQKALQDENYQIQKLVLASQPDVPSDCAVLLVVGPQKEPLAGELQSMEAYLGGGGKIMILVDPSPAASLSDFMARYGLEVGQDLVIDASGVGRLFGTGPAMPLVTSYPPHAITADFDVMTFFPMARSISPKASSPQGYMVEPLLQTSDNSWGETQVKGEQVRFDRGQDLEGPVTIAAVVQQTTSQASADTAATEPKGRLVVFGDSDFASNAYFSFSGNGDLFMNAMNWLAEEEELISIRPKDAADRRVTLTAGQSRMIFYLSVIVMPVAVLILGTLVWIRRR